MQPVRPLGDRRGCVGEHEAKTASTTRKSLLGEGVEVGGDRLLTAEALLITRRALDTGPLGLQRLEKPDATMLQGSARHSHVEGRLMGSPLACCWLQPAALLTRQEMRSLKQRRPAPLLTHGDLCCSPRARSTLCAASDWSYLRHQGRVRAVAVCAV